MFDPNKTAEFFRSQGMIILAARYYYTDLVSTILLNVE